MARDPSDPGRVCSRHEVSHRNFLLGFEKRKHCTLICYFYGTQFANSSQFTSTAAPTRGPTPAKPAECSLLVDFHFRTAMVTRMGGASNHRAAMLTQTRETAMNECGISETMRPETVQFHT
jgi:hypothetical protein